MTTPDFHRKKTAPQKGAALIIVLVLVATLSFIVLAIAQVTTLAAHRDVNFSARQELLWRSIGVESLTRSAFKALYENEEIRITPDNPVFSTVHPMPMDDGAGQIYFLDRTACFNINSLVERSGGGLTMNEDSKSEFLALASSININGGEALTIASAAIDWIDTDERVEPGGAEDGFYSGLPVPYRTGSVLIADLSELRAISGYSKEIFGALRPFLCAHPQTTPAVVNVNFLTLDRAPVLVGLLQGKLSLSEAQAIIEARPPGGYSTIEEFMALVNNYFEEPVEGLAERLTLKSSYVAARSELELGPARLDATMLFSIDENGKALLISRQYGGEE